MARRGRCHRQRRLRRWSFSALLLPVFIWKLWLGFVCKGFPELFHKDYDKHELEMTNEELKAQEDRFAGYKSICMFGLGSLFWGSATGYLGQLKDKDDVAGKQLPEWTDLWFGYSAFALVSMLLGFTASIFPKSSWFAPSFAGFGSLQALLLVLAGFHVASLKYHPYENECKYSVIGSSIIVTIYWGLSVQDPLILHILVKLIFWVPSLLIYELFKGVGKAWQYGTCAWTKAKTKMLALKNNLTAQIHTSNNYHRLPSPPEVTHQTCPAESSV